MSSRRFFQRRKNINDDLGLGSKVTTERIMNKDGSFFMDRVGDSKFRSYEIYHTLITISWTRFLFYVLTAYFVVNIIFAYVYFYIGVEHLTGINMAGDSFQRFIEAFFFSSQTLTTVGFGRIAPLGTLTSTVAAVESMMGVLSFAIATGLLYGRFSRPLAKLIYSKNAIIAPFKEGTGLMFRISNLRHNQLLEVEINVTLAYFDKGAKTRSFERLKLERDKVVLFPTSWTIVHPIDEESPFYGLTEEEIPELKAEVLVLLKAFDDTFSQTIYSRAAYHSDDLLWGKKFIPMFSLKNNGQTLLNLRMIDDFVDVTLPSLTTTNDSIAN